MGESKQKKQTLDIDPKNQRYWNNQFLDIRHIPVSCPKKEELD